MVRMKISMILKWKSVSLLLFMKAIVNDLFSLLCKLVEGKGTPR